MEIRGVGGELQCGGYDLTPPLPLLKLVLVEIWRALTPLNPTALTMKQQNVTLRLLHYLLITLINSH